MPRSVWIFLTVILLPSFALAWLAVRSVREQQILLEHQQTLLDQGVADSTAQLVSAEMGRIQEEFAALVQHLMQGEAAAQLALQFDARIRAAWDFAEVGFAVGPDGVVLSPQISDSAGARLFLTENERFLSNRENARVYAANNMNAANTQANFSVQQNARLAQGSPSQGQSIFNAAPAASDFRRIVAEGTSGSLARYLDNRLRLMVWFREPSAVVFGAQLRQAVLLERLSAVLDANVGQSAGGGRAGAFSLALCDDTGKVVAVSRGGHIPGLKAGERIHPFVVAEIGDALPHWQVALYLTDPSLPARSAHTLQFTLGLIVFALLAAIVMGGWLVALDVRRRMVLAQQKADFVSNISHELKTPLTSIRLFADLLASGRVTDPAKQTSYLQIIAAECARLTRLINNVLDFARLDRGTARLDRQPCDLSAIAKEVADSLRPHLDSEKITFRVEFPPDRLPIQADRDAMAQILINLLSNAEKYGRGEILLRAGRRDSHAFVEVLDRGPGIPPAQVEAIFQPFQRLEDSLASGIPGTGLGLSLARHNAAAHGGRIACSLREGGGSCFTFIIPLSA